MFRVKILFLEMNAPQRSRFCGLAFVMVTVMRLRLSSSVRRRMIVTQRGSLANVVSCFKESTKSFFYHFFFYLLQNKFIKGGWVVETMGVDVG